MNAPPRWFWLLPLLAMAAWWPLEPWWQSDDFFAVHYVQDGRAVLRDFVGPQYGATDIWAFYRPLITASFWLDQQLGGPWPGLSHCSNVVAHGLSALLLALIWRRFLPVGAAFGAGLLWAWSPSHAAAIQWAVGRVDSHSMVWCCLIVWCSLRAHERGQTLALAPMLATAGALGSKEIAMIAPAIATLVLFARVAGTCGERARGALRATAGPWGVLLAYLPFRLFVLHTFGGYDAAVFAAGPVLAGLGQEFVNFLSPVRWIGVPDWLPLPAGVWIIAGAIPAAVALLVGALRALPRAALAFAIAATSFVPMLSLLAAADNPQLMRYWYVPAAALVGIMANGGRWLVLAVLLAWAGPFVLLRAERHCADVQSATMHRALIAQTEAGAKAPLFVGGLPPVNANGTVIQLHYAVDRLLAPPFTAHTVPLYALRPLALGPGIFTLFDTTPWALPEGSTWQFAGTALQPAPPPPELPDLPIRGDNAGVVDLTTPVLDALAPEDAPALVTPAVHSPWFRLTLFTGSGYLASVFANHAEANAPDGSIVIRTWFAGDPTRSHEPGRIGFPGPLYIGDALGLPTTVDMAMEFPALLEAGDLDLAGPQPKFEPSHRARRLLRFRFDRGYCAWVRRVQGIH